jgi:hypothetical protein
MPPERGGFEMGTKTVVAIVLGAAFALSAVAGEKRITKADVPHVVLAAAGKKHEIVFSSTGELTKEEAKSPREN